MTIDELYEKKGRLLKQIEDAVKDAEKKDGEFDQETMNTRFEGWYAELEQLEETIRNREKADQLLAAQAQPVDNHKPEVKDLKDPERFNKALKAWAIGDFHTLNEEDKAVLRANQFYAGTDNKGGYLVPDQWSNFIASAETFVGGMVTPGLCSKLTTANGQDIKIPTVYDTEDGYGIAEKTDHTSSAADMTFAEATLSAKNVTSGLVKVSHELLTDNAFDFASWLFQALAERVTRAKNKKLTYNTGTVNLTGALRSKVTSGEAGGSRSITRTDLVNLMYSINRSYFMKGSWMFNSNTMKAIRVLVQSSTYNNSPLWQESMRSGEPSLLEGKPYYINEHMDDIQPSDHPVFFGDFSRYYIREVKPDRLIRLDELYAATDEVGFVVNARIDGNLAAYSSDYPIKSIRCATT